MPESPPKCQDVGNDRKKARRCHVDVPAGVDLYDIMKVTGHTSPAMLKKYFKAENLKVVEKLTDKYDYFR